MLRKLLRQPGPHFTNALLALAVPPLLVGFPLASVVFDEFYQVRRVFGWREGVILFFGALAFSHALAWLVRSQIAGRQAVRIIATRFAAAPPDVPGEPWSCHSCGGSLPDGGRETVVLQCAYCRADNVTGFNLVPSAARESAQARDLATELGARLATRRRYRLIALASLALLIAATWALLPVVLRALEG